MPRLLPIPLLLAFAVTAPGENEIRFNRDIRPLLSDRCFACHGPDAAKAEAGLQLHTAEAATAPLDGDANRRALVPGDREASELWLRINAADPGERMPPPESNHRLDAEEIDLLGRWIDAGATYEGHWAYQPVRPGGGGSIDDFIRARLEAAGLAPSPRAGRATLLRRVTQDLTGLPPTPAEVSAYLEDAGPEEEAWAAVVDRLLASPRHAERLAVDWLDGARYADTNGYSIDDHRDMWIWRDWVLHAFLHNKPVDRFAVEQLAGDLLPGAGEQERVATGFLRNGMNTHEGGTIPEEYRVTYHADKVDTVATVFMGLTMKCAQCHDHKYDPVTQEEYYRFFAFFNASSEPGSGAINANTGPLIEASSPICPPERVRDDHARRMAELDRLRVFPDAPLAAARDAWEAGRRAALAPAASAAPLPLLPESGAPAWIWAPDDPRAAQVELRRTFTLDETPAAALLRFTCDDSAVITLNGKELARNTLWTEPVTLTVPVDRLREGPNRLAVRAENGTDSPAGFILSLALRDQSGDITHLLSDARWEARLGHGDGAGPWKPAREVGRYGDAPWGQALAAPGTGDDAALARALRTAPGERDLAAWKTVNDAFAAESPAFKIYSHQLDIEQKAIAKAAETGRATVMVMDHRPRPTHILVRGAYDQPGAEVGPGLPAVLPPAAGEVTTRLDLARWLVAPEHPLTARVIVNRYWQMLFGTGLVRTAEDFGAQGEYPSHPGLLDWLAADFVRHGWDLRRLLRQMVLSETYRQVSRATPALLAADPDNRLLARAPRRRLPAEFIRDGALAAAGLLDDDLGGPSVHPPQPDGLWAEVSHYGYPAGFTAQKYLPGTGRSVHRRSLYTAWKRTSPPPGMAIFDAPNRETCTVRRLRTNTPLQALVLQNDPQYLEAARALGRLMAATGSVEEGIAHGALRVLGRRPRPDEATVLDRAWHRYREAYAGRAGEARALLDEGEDAESPAGAAAWTLVASTLLNMDEAVTCQ